MQNPSWSLIQQALKDYPEAWAHLKASYQALFEPQTFHPGDVVQTKNREFWTVGEADDQETVLAIPHSDGVVRCLCRKGLTLIQRAEDTQTPIHGRH